MVTQKRMLDEALRLYKTDAGIAEALKVTGGFISQVRAGTSTLNPAHAGMLARVLDQDVWAWVCSAEAAKAKSKEHAEFWKWLSERAKNKAASSCEN